MQKIVYYELDTTLKDLHVYCKYIHQKIVASKYRKKYYKEHKEEEKQWRLKYYSNPDNYNKLLSYSAKYQKTRRLIDSKYRAKCYTCNTECVSKRLATDSAYREAYNKRSREYTRNRRNMDMAYKEYLKEKARRFYAEHPDYKALIKSYTHSRRMMEDICDREYLIAVSEIEANKNNICYWCGNPIPQKELSIDHKIPIAKGGTNSKDNIVPAHIFCNISKSAKMPWEYLKYCIDVGRDIDRKFKINDSAVQTILF